MFCLLFSLNNSCMHNIINVWGYTEILHNLCFLSAVFWLVKHFVFHLTVTCMCLTWPSFNFFHCDFEGDEERGRQKLKPNILSLSFDIFNPDFLFIQIYYYLLISLAVKYS